MHIDINGKRTDKCDECLKNIPSYVDAPNGYVSPDGHLFKPSQVGGMPGVEAVEKVVCRECYIKNFKKVYPGEELPAWTKNKPQIS